MIAVDTNVVIRYVIGDDPVQASRARALIDGSSVFVATTTLLEIECVLRRAYRINAHAIVATLRSFAGLPNVTLEQAAVVATALDFSERGVDLADALHLAAAEHCTAFATFDRALVKRGRDLSSVQIREP